MNEKLCEEDIMMCKELAMFIKENNGKFDEIFPKFHNKLWEVSKKYHLNPADAFAIFMKNYNEFKID